MDFRDGDEVVIDERACLPAELTNGIVLGKALTPLPILGAGYIVDVGRKISEEYPYSACMVFELHLKLVYPR